MHVALRKDFFEPFWCCTATACVTEADGGCYSAETQDKGTFKGKSSVQDM